MGLTRCSFACHISSFTSERTQMLDRVVSLHISNIYAKKKGIAKKLILTLRAIMISQEVDLVAGDLNGTLRGGVVGILPTPPGPHHCGDLDPFRTIGQTSVDFSNHLALNVFGK